MPKKKPVKKTKANKKTSKNTGLKTFENFFIKHKVVGILLILLGIWGLVWFGQASIERYNFYRVEKTMDSITKEINTNFKVISQQKDRSCGKRDEAFGSHLGGCSITYIYSVAPSEDSKKTALEIDNLVQNRTDVRVDNPDPVLIKKVTFVQITKLDRTDPDKYSSSYSFAGVSNPTCEVVYTLPKSKTQGDVYISLSCFLTGRDAKLPYFPVQQ